MAAAFQSAVYGGLIPAGGVFAGLTSLGMTGLLAPVAAVAGAIAGMCAAVTAAVSFQGKF